MSDTAVRDASLADSTGTGRAANSMRPTRNRLLGFLPRAELARLRPDLEQVTLAQHTVLHHADEQIDHVFFPLNGVASLVASGEQGEQVDTAIVGREGMVGLPVFLGTESMPVRAIVQLDMDALRVPSAALRQELERGGELGNLLRRYAQMVLVELAQLVLCNRAHSIEHRVARWILQLTDRIDGAVPFDMTHEFLASMIGSPRPHVAEVLKSLRERGLIDYGRGTMELLDKDGLEMTACRCYRTIRDELDRLLVTQQRHTAARR